MNDRSSQYMTSRRVRDRSIIILLLGLALLVSPMASIFQIDAKLAGVPVTLIYLFAVWAILILGAAYLSRKLGHSEDTDTQAQTGRRR